MTCHLLAAWGLVTGMNRHLFPLAALILFAACLAGSPQSPGASRPSQESGPPGTPGASPTRSTVPLASGPAMTVTLVGAAPVIHRADGPPNHAAVMPAAAAVDADGSIVAFLVWFGPARGDHPVTVARSIDGRAWSINQDPIYKDLGMALAHPGPIPGTALRAPDGTWLLYGWATTDVQAPTFFSWRATAAAPEGPWSVASGDERVLPPGPAGSWDDSTAAVSAILAQGQGFSMWYEGQRPGRTTRGGIGYASSADGVTWSRFDDPATETAGDPNRPTVGDPVLGPGACGPATAAAALGPQVWVHGDGYLMLFLGSAGQDGNADVLGAVSADGISWSCTGKVLLTAADIPGSQGIHTIQGAMVGGEPVLLIESLTDGGSDIWLATVAVGP